VQGVAELKAHPFLASVNWAAVANKKVKPPLKPKDLEDSLDFCPTGTMVANMSPAAFHWFTMVSPPAETPADASGSVAAAAADAAASNQKVPTPRNE
jgi:hypothetical protein